MLIKLKKTKLNKAAMWFGLIDVRVEILRGHDVVMPDDWCLLDS